MKRVSREVRWRLILDGRNGAAWNMAVDEAILDAVIQGISRPTIRMYRWDPPAISVGRFQSLPRAVNLDACRRFGVEVVRRPTGGRAVLHDEDETVSIILPVQAVGSAGASVSGSYRLLSQGFSDGLARLGLSLRQGGAERRVSPSADCFAVRTSADLVTPDGTKVVGSAQYRRSGVILQQSSIVHRPPSISPQEVFLGPVSYTTFPLEDAPEGELRLALREGFGRALGITLFVDDLTAWEYERAGALLQRVKERTTGGS
ncbi:MAG: lipoate--protein ligase family protein [Chthonomonadales bacterium]